MMFERWIKLFGDTCGELFEEPVAEAFAQCNGSRDPRVRHGAVSTKCVVLDGRGFIRQDKWFI